MSYSTGPERREVHPQDPRLQGYGRETGRYTSTPTAGTGRGLPFLFTVGVILLGVLSFFLGFAPYERESATGELPNKSSVTFFDNVGLGAGVVGLSLLVAAALVAAFGMLPRQPANEPIVAGLSVAGLLSLLCLLVGLAGAVEAGVGLILVLVASFLQAALAIGNVLISAGIVRLGSSEPDVRQPQSGYGWQQPYPHQPQPSVYGHAPGTGRFSRGAPGPTDRTTPPPNWNR
jgi:hypothetical protein